MTDYIMMPPKGGKGGMADKVFKKLFKKRQKFAFCCDFTKRKEMTIRVSRIHR